ncbi:hypothetical protein CDIK_1691 [Cucumispora dikerogammari]|nr:hypothetical protein CDIK_1691 [Cucumispora dikerogammari]
MKNRLNTAEKTNKKTKTDESSASSTKSPKGSRAKNKNTSNSNQAYGQINQENKNKQCSTATLSLLYSSLPNYGNELTNKELSTEKYCYYFFGYYTAVCYLESIENKLQEGLRLDFNKQTEILECLPEVYINSEGNEMFFSKSQLLQNFDALPAHLFISVPKVSRKFSKDFMTLMFSNLHTENYFPELLEYELRRVQLNIEHLKTKIIAEIPRIDYIEHVSFHTRSYKVSDINKYDEFIHLFREANIIKKQIIHFEVDNKLARKLISIVNNLLKVLNNYVYFKEVFLKENNLVVPSRSSDNDLQKNFEAKVMLSLANDGFDPNKIYFDSEKTLREFKKTIVEYSNILNAYTKKKRKTLRSKKARERRYSTVYYSKNLKEDLKNPINYKSHKKKHIEFVNRTLDINRPNKHVVDINNEKNKTKNKKQNVSTVIHEPKYFLGERPLTCPKKNGFSTQGNAQSYDKLNVSSNPNISINRRPYIKNVEKPNTHFNFHQASFTAQFSALSNLKQQSYKSEFFKRRKIATTQGEYEQTGSIFTYSSDSTRIDSLDINTSKKLKISNMREKYKSLHSFLSKPGVNAEQYSTHVDTVKDHQHSNSHLSQQQTNTVQCQAHIDPLHYPTSTHMTGNIDTSCESRCCNDKSYLLSRLGIILPRLCELFVYISPEYKGIEELSFTWEINSIIKHYRYTIEKFLIKTRALGVVDFTEEELKLICKKFGLGEENYEEKMLLKIKNAKILLLKLKKLSWGWLRLSDF